MILTDTTVVVPCVRNPSARLLSIIQTYDAAICGVTVAEIYAGARNPADFARLTAALSVFRYLPIPDSIWSSLGHYLQALRSQGITVPFPDALIAAVAIENGIELWTYDAHFTLIQRVLAQLRLFQEPP